MNADLSSLARGLPLDPLPPLPREIDASVPHAPARLAPLNEREFEQAVANALRYFPESYHERLAPEFIDELRTDGHIYMRRFRPTHYKIRAYPIDDYPAKCRAAAAIMLMICNNLDDAVAQYPHELVTYGGNGSVLSNWAQFHVLMKYLSEMTEEQTLTMYSGHPMGLFPSSPDAPRVVVTNGMVIPNYSSKDDYNRMFAMGTSMFGQMTAGSYAYIGPQGIVHGTTITILNSGRKYLNSNDLSGKVYLSSGLGGMSGAQAKAAVICGAIGVIAEVDRAAATKRHEQGWVDEVVSDLDACIDRIRTARGSKIAISIAYLGNVVDLWERLANETDHLIDLASDQTSLHNPWNGGYYPAEVTFDEANRMMVDDPPAFKLLVESSLRRQVAAINKLTARGLQFWDYGNCFLLEASRAGAEVMKQDGSGEFVYPSYVQDIMGDVFSLGFGPFRWVCTSGDPNDLATTDRIAKEVTESLKSKAPARTAEQYEDNLRWIKQAGANKMVVGSQARILYSDAEGRIAIAVAFNNAIRDRIIKSPVVISRDHHDVSGTDSPFRETSDVYDGSSFSADMAIQNVIGDGFRGATWISIHNGGGVGWGEVINGGFGMLLDGSASAETRARSMLHWDVNNGVARRAWAGNENAKFAIDRAMKSDPLLRVTNAATVDRSKLRAVINNGSA